MTETFPADTGVTVSAVTTSSGDWSFAWREPRGITEVSMEAVWVLGRARWVLFVDGGAEGLDLDWPAPDHHEDAREIARERAGR